MGQYLAIGIVTTIKVEKSDCNKMLLGIDRLQEKIHVDFHFLPEIYEVTGDETYHFFKLRENIVASQLVSLLETLYPLLYPKAAYYSNVLEQLRALPSSEWLQWSKNKSEEAFQFDKYGSCDYLYETHSKVCLHYEAILISMEGKIGMETYGRQFNFIKYAIKQAFQQFSLAGSLRIYITG